ncbi:MAG: SDR family NAD(P)-dependent oxidoreductase [Sphingobacteriaceae bacterium]|nr:MAG: SDR family NAD(P)-dependent oxidoreductase [Sphingobacteriaceae bacterium]
MQLSDNTILITGGTSGIGLAFAEAFVAAGSKVIICGRREERLDNLCQKYPDLITKKCDISIAAEREELADWVLQNYPGLNLLMNNAGIQLLTDMTNPVDLTRIYDEIETNVVAPIHLTSLFAQHLATKPAAAIVNISSGLAFAPLAFMPIYCATKAAVHSLTLSLRHQLKNTSVKVFEIAPPAVDTELGHDRREDKTQSHGGLPIADFIAEAMEALKNDVFEAPIGMAKGLREKREQLFEVMNNQAPAALPVNHEQ